MPSNHKVGQPLLAVLRRIRLRVRTLIQSDARGNEGKLSSRFFSSPKNFLATCTSSVPTLSCAQQIPLLSFAVSVTQPTSVPAILSHTRATQSITLPLFLSLQWLAHSFSLLPLFFASPSFVFNRLQTLFAKHRGVWVPACRAVHESQATNHESRRFCLPFVFMVLQIAFPASPFLSQSSALPPRVSPPQHLLPIPQGRKDEAPPQPMIGFRTPWHPL